MSKRKKIVLVTLASIAVLVLLFIGWHYIRFLKATSRMKVVPLDCDTIITARDLGISFGD